MLLYAKKKFPHPIFIIRLNLSTTKALCSFSAEYNLINPAYCFSKYCQHFDCKTLFPYQFLSAFATVTPFLSCPNFLVASLRKIA